MNQFSIQKSYYLPKAIEEIEKEPRSVEPLVQENPSQEVINETKKRTHRSPLEEMSSILSKKSEKIEIKTNCTPETGFEATIETPNLRLTTVSEKDTKEFALLFGDSELMKTYGDGIPYTEERMKERITKQWLPRLEKGYPYAAFAIRNKKSGEFIGYAVLGHPHQKENGAAELAYLFHKPYWGKDALEAISAIVNHYAPLLAKEYLIKDQTFTLIKSTARDNDEKSWRILESVGMKYNPEENKVLQDKKDPPEEFVRRFYTLKLADIPHSSIRAKL